MHISLIKRAEGNAFLWQQKAFYANNMQIITFYALKEVYISPTEIWKLWDFVHVRRFLRIIELYEKMLRWCGLYLSCILIFYNFKVKIIEFHHINI